MTDSEVFKPTLLPQLATSLPSSTRLKLDPQIPLLVYNFYNLDPQWRKSTAANRVLLLEPSLFKRYPISDKSLKFMLKLAQTIDQMQVFCGEYHELIRVYGKGPVFYKEHPLNKEYEGTEDSRDWMFAVKGDFPSFFSFWKQCKKELL